MVWKPVDTPGKEEIADFLKDHRKIARFLVDESVGIEVASQMKGLGLNVKYGITAPTTDMVTFSRTALNRSCARRISIFWNW